MSAFRLAGLLRVREMLEEQAAGELALANAAAHEATTAHREALNALSRHAPPQVASPTDFAVAIAARAGLNIQIERALDVVADAQMHVQVAHEAWSNRRRETSMLEKLHTRHSLSVLEEQQREEQALIDELATTRRQTKTQEGHR